MRKRFKGLIFVSLVSLITLLSIGTAFAPAPSVPIGGAEQLYPFESQPTADIAGSKVAGASAYDSDITTATAAITLTTAGFVGFESFSKPSDAGGTDFAIEYVDFKMRYTCTGSTDDEYRIVFYVGTTGPVVLKDWIGGTNTLCKMDMGADTLAETWGNQSEPTDGTWTWADIADIKFRFETQVVGAPDFPPPPPKDALIYEVWLSVYPTAPPEASTTISVMPTQVEKITDWGILFVDLYVTDVTALQLYEVELHYDSAALYAWEAWTYWPFTANFYLDLSVAGVVQIGYYIDPGIPYNGGYLTDVGYNGTYPVARLYFYDYAAPPSWLTYAVTKLIAPGGVYLPHMDWHGVYGTPAATSHLMTWKSASEFPWDAPVCTHWVEIFPEAGREWHLSSVEEPWVEPLKPSDQIDMTMEDPPTGEVWWFHVDEITETTHDPTPGSPDPYSVTMLLTFKYKEEPEFPLGIGILMMITPLIPIIYLWRRKEWKK